MSSQQPYTRTPRFIKKPGRAWYNNGFMLYLLPLLAIPATIKAFIGGNLFGIIINAGCYAAYLLAAYLLRKGLAAENSYLERRVSLAPKWPLKSLATLIVAVNTFILSWLGAHYPFSVAIAFGLGAWLGMYLSYGFDPRKTKTIVGSHGFTAEEIINTINAAQRVIENIEHANKQIRNREFNQRIERICDTARNILIDLEANPAAIRRTRKFLLVYLEGTEKITTGYAGTHLEANTLEQNFRNALDTIENVFKEQKERLLQEDLFDLDVQIDVLTTQLKQEGVI